MHEFLKQFNPEQLRNDHDYFEDAKISLAEKIAFESETPVDICEALSMAQDQLMIEAGF